jgi:hypothetical protein
MPGRDWADVNREVPPVPGESPEDWFARVGSEPIRYAPTESMPNGLDVIEARAPPPDFDERAPPSGDEETRQTSNLNVHDAGDIDVSKIPPRQWLLGVSFCRKFISGLIGTGGAGKTAVRYPQYLSLGTGRNLTGEHVHVRSRVLIACFEDDLDEIRRRIAAAMLHHRIAPHDVKGWIYYCCPRGLKLLRIGQDRDTAVGELYTELRRIVEELKIDLLSIDPFIKAHGVEENDNNLIDQACIMLATLGDELNCGVDINSHARKGEGVPGDAERDRGASAKKDAGRLMRTIGGMASADAELFKIPPRDVPTYVRVDDAKVNIVRKSTQAMWFKLVDVELGNTDVNPLYPHGDHVHAAERWYPPDVFAALDNSTISRILDRIEAGPYEGGRYSTTFNAKARSAIPALQEFCPELADEQAKHVIKTWLRTGVLIKRDHEDPKDRHEHPSLFVGKRPGDTWER